METRGMMGMPKVQRMPMAWEKRPLELGMESEQGPMVTSKPTSRSLAPLPGDTNTILEEAGSFVGSIMSSRPGMKREEKTPPTPQGDTGGFGAVDLDHTTGKPTKGTTKGRGTF